ncbi:PRC-barrel domain-containing protein [Enterovirga rhinocerotis]|uniref:Sporulation protein YlmC with PRC-barrel domain n=1 Tax=Enterovirga rhinocerotis TaxID=1339210 RepID=A0A4R7CA59_9HYPH|nr:PRC-barrel domain-containing protein [Enterovirga rhinocerotis]TDR93856.1 sporulation protein YlmC with PRC-barrel domain [Enterovirga rhinocerotis]
MRSTTMGTTFAALLLSTSLVAGGAMAQTSDATAPATTAPTTTAPTTPPAPMAASGSFVTSQGVGEFRASKFVGVDIYGSENEKIGDVSEVILDDKGMAKAVVVGVGGFLGIGQKSVAMPWSAVTWSNDAPPTKSAARTEPTATGSTATRAPTAAGTTPPATATRSPAEQAAYNGYPAHGKVALTKAQLESAPTFEYFGEKASNAPAPATRQ